MPKNKKISKNKSKSSPPNYYKIAALLIIVIVAIYFFFISGGKSLDNNEEEYMFRKDGELTFLDSSGMVLTNIDIQIARNEYDRELGLMFRKTMNENQGMLFIFPDERVRNFWMRNTEIPLDMIFINDSKTILNIAKNTIPYSDTSYSSAGPARYVLEVNGGFTERHKIIRGVKVNWTLTH